MNKLVLLEMKKSGKGSVLKAVSKIWIPLVIALTLLLLFFLIDSISYLDYIPSGEYEEIVKDFAELPPMGTMFFQITSLVGLIFTAAMYASYVVRDVKTKKIQQLYLYPISKHKILLSKMMTAFLMGLVSMVVCSIMGILLILLVKNQPIAASLYFRQLQDVFLVPLVGLIPMVIGMKRKSVISTVVSGVLLSVILGGNFGPFTLWSYSWVNIILATIGVYVSFRMLKNPKTTECFG